MKSFRLLFVTLCLIVMFSINLFATGEKEASAEKITTLHAMAVTQTFVKSVKHVEEEAYRDLGIKLEYDFAPPQDAFGKVMIEFAVGKSSYDVIRFMPANIADYSAHLEPLEPLMKKYGVTIDLSDVEKIYRDYYCEWDNVLYGIPWDADQHLLFYNTEAFGDSRNKSDFVKKYGYELAPPSTWDQYVDIAEFFSGRDWDFDGKPEFGIVEAWQRGGYAYWWWWDKFIPLGGLPFDEDMNPLIDSAPGQKALEIMVKIAKYCPPGTVNFGYPESESAFIKGDAPMLINWSSAGKAAMDPTRSDIVNKVGVTLIPGVRVGGKIIRRATLPTGWSMCIPKYSKNKELAIKFIARMSEPQNRKKIVTDIHNAVDPFLRSSLSTELWASIWPDNPEFGKDMARTMTEALKGVVPDLTIPASDEYLKALDAEISAAIIGNKTVQQALSDAAKEWNKITERRGREEQRKAWLQQYSYMKKSGITYEPSWANTVNLD